VTFDRLEHPKIETQHTDGDPNGFLVPIYNIHENWYSSRPAQVYLTVVLPGKCKGPHLHHMRNGAFTCVKGNVKIVIKDGDNYEEHLSGEDYGYATVFVPIGKPSMVVNVCGEEAYVLNMPFHAYRKEDNDELIPKDWDYDPKI